MLEHPVERIIAALPYWRGSDPPESESVGDLPQEQTFEFVLFFAGNADQQAALLGPALTALEAAVSEAGATQLRYQAALPSNHPICTQFTEKGYAIVQTDRHFTIPGESMKACTHRIYDRIQPRIPDTWRLESIRGYSAEEIYTFIAPHALMPPQQFKQYWDSSNREHFEENYSCILLNDQGIIGVFLVTQRGKDELHIQIEASHPESKGKSHLIAASLRNHSFSHCAPGFPDKFTFKTDSESPLKIRNTAIRNKGSEDPPRHFLAKHL